MTFSNKKCSKVFFGSEHCDVMLRKILCNLPLLKVILIVTCIDSDIDHKKIELGLNLSIKEIAAVDLPVTRIFHQCVQNF